jgi:hypothetical protein
LQNHQPWRSFLDTRRGKKIGDSKKYDSLYRFTSIRNAVMHGRVLFPTYREFKKYRARIRNIGPLIELLDEYLKAGTAQE